VIFKSVFFWELRAQVPGDFDVLSNRRRDLRKDGPPRTIRGARRRLGQIGWVAALLLLSAGLGMFVTWRVPGWTVCTEFG